MDATAIKELVSRKQFIIQHEELFMFLHGYFSSSFPFPKDFQNPRHVRMVVLDVQVRLIEESHGPLRGTPGGIFFLLEIAVMLVEREPSGNHRSKS